ncbi:acyl-CoA dehydrogenase family protein [Pseudonocardia acaciae]|uniref:acyl-CoA dehydrogenase family protein n=1 Tax=Pseudonocardia acaciae TaxID=551276 RepID=UPI0006877E2D|nr:acyl-CoA dehydrogenase family protein [Pseudonocardia acaciae]
MSVTTNMSADLRERADQVAELAGRYAADLAVSDQLPAEIVRACLDAGLYRLCLPGELGGARVPLPDSVEAIERLSYADGSVGWCAVVANVGASLLAGIDRRQAAVIAAVPERLCIAGGFPATGRGVRADGGYLLTGRWSFASGARAATWLLGGMTVPPAGDGDGDGDGPAWLVGFFPAEQARIVPNWDVIGLRATGSHDVVADEVLVPAGRTTPLVGPRWSNDPIAAVPFFALGPLLGAVPLGIARRALDELVKLAGTRVRFGQPRPLAADPGFQDRFTSVLARLGAARSYLADRAAEVWRTAVAGEVTPMAQAGAALAVGEAAEAALDAVQFAHREAGTAAIRADGVLTRCLTDTMVATRHVAFSQFFRRDAGRRHLGVPA